MNNIIKMAIETFETVSHYDKEDGKWILENIEKIMTDFYNLHESEEISVIQYTKENFDEEKIKIVLNKLIPYITGHYGVLTMTFETKAKEKVNVMDFLIAREVGKENIKCTTEDGKEVGYEDVFVVFTRNNKR